MSRVSPRDGQTRMSTRELKKPRPAQEAPRHSPVLSHSDSTPTHSVLQASSSTVMLIATVRLRQK